MPTYDVSIDNERFVKMEAKTLGALAKDIAADHSIPNRNPDHQFQVSKTLKHLLAACRRGHRAIVIKQGNKIIAQED